MTNAPVRRDLHDRITALLETSGAGEAVAQELHDREDAWRRRAVIGDLRARRARHHQEKSAPAQGLRGPKPGETPN